MLSHLVGKGLFREAPSGRFALNEAAEGLLDPSQRLGLDLDGIGGRFAYAWGTLPTYVRTGAPGYHEVFGQPFWEDVATHPQIAASFDALRRRVPSDDLKLPLRPRGLAAHDALLEHEPVLVLCR